MNLKFNPQAGCTCENGGECALVGGGGGGGEKRLECSCPEGFAGERCEECEGSPGLCQNGGVCVKDALGQPMCRLVKPMTIESVVQQDFTTEIRN